MQPSSNVHFACSLPEVSWACRYDCDAVTKACSTPSCHREVPVVTEISGENWWWRGQVGCGVGPGAGRDRKIRSHHCSKQLPIQCHGPEKKKKKEKKSE